MTYVRPLISTASADIGMCSSENPPRSSRTLPRATSLAGSVMSTTCMPSSSWAAATAYSLPPNSSVSVAIVPPRVR